MKIDGRKIAADILKSLKTDVGKLKRKRIQPHLVAVLVGSDSGSLSYVSQKSKAARIIGAKVTIHRFDKIPLYQSIAEFISGLNQDPKVHGVIIQRPLPPSLSAGALNKIVSVNKDVDGFLDKSPFEPPIGVAVFKLLGHIYYRQLKKTSMPRDDFSKSLVNWLKNKQIVLLGHGETGGQPVSQTLNTCNIPFIVLNSTVENKDEYLKDADIVISAVGKPNMIKAEMIKPGCILLGIGVHRGDKTGIVGDYDEKAVDPVAGFYTSTPGGMGPVNVACLLQNLITAAKMQKRG